MREYQTRFDVNHDAGEEGSPFVAVSTVIDGQEVGVDFYYDPETGQITEHDPWQDGNGILEGSDEWSGARRAARTALIVAAGGPR